MADRPPKLPPTEPPSLPAPPVTVRTAAAVTAPPVRRRPATGPALASPGAAESTVLRDPLEGVQLGDYQVLEQLGEGGMGIVYRGVQPLIGKAVAIKVLRPEVAADASQVEQLLAEARAVNAVRDPGIVDIFGFGLTPDGRQYVVMELLEGLSLHQMKQRGPMLPGELIDILDQVMAALSAAHGAGIIHRDLKPGNIVVREMPDGTLRTKLLDFGLAKLTEPGANAAPQTNAGFVRGTPEYMAPEQARGAAVGPRTDLYAMGVVAFELLTGQLPFDSDNIATLLQLQLTAAPPRPRSLEPSIPEGLEELVLRLLAKAPAERPGSANEVRRELQRLRKDLQEAGTQVGKMGPAAMQTVPAAPAVPRGAEEPPQPITRKQQPPVLTAPPWANARTLPLPALTAVTLGPSQTDPGVEASSDTNPVMATVEATRVVAAAGGSRAGRWALLVLLLALLAATVAGWLQAQRSSAPTAPTAPSDER